MSQRFLTPSPPEGSDMNIKLINLRIKRGYGMQKSANKVYDDDGRPIDGKFEWANASPEHRNEGYGGPPIPNYSADGYKTKYWPEQRTELNKQTTAHMLYRAAYTRFYSGL